MCSFLFLAGGEEEGEEKYLTSRSQRELASVARSLALSLSLFMALD
jgi:hypothetical protein